MLKKLLSRRPPEAESTGVEAPVARRHSGGLRLGLLWLLAFLFTALAVGGAGYATWRQMQSQLDAQHQALQKSQGDRLAAELAARIQMLTEQGERAAAQPALAAVMAGGDPAAIAAQAETIAANLPGALRVRVLPPGDNQPDESSTPRLGYAGLDLARQAETGKRPGLEIHWPGAPDEYIALARPIAAPQQPVAGVLLVAFDPRLLDRWLAASVPEGALVEIRQAAGDATVIGSRGDKNRGALPPSGSAPLAGTQWELVWWLPPGASASLQTQIDFFAPLVAAVGLLALLFFILAAINNRLVRSDLGGLLTHVAGLLEHTREAGYKVRLTDFRQALEALDERFLPPPPEPPAPHAPHTPPAVAPTAQPSSVPENPLFLPQDTIQVEEVDDEGDKQ